MENAAALSTVHSPPLADRRHLLDLPHDVLDRVAYWGWRRRWWRWDAEDGFDAFENAAALDDRNAEACVGAFRCCCRQTREAVRLSALQVDTAVDAGATCLPAQVRFIWIQHGRLTRAAGCLQVLVVTATLCMIPAFLVILVLDVAFGLPLLSWLASLLKRTRRDILRAIALMEYALRALRE